MKYSSLICFLFLTAPVWAQPTLPDELRALIGQANTHFPRLKEQQALIQAGELRTDIARTALQPVVSANASYQYINPVPKANLPVNGRDVSVQFQPNHNGNASLNVAVPIYDWGRTRANVARAQDDVQLAKDNLELTRFNLAYQVAGVYYGIGFLQRSLAVQDSVIKTATGNIQVIANRLRNGDALQFDVLTQQVRLETAKNRKIDIQNQLDRQRALLTYLTGVPTAAQTIGEAARRFDGFGALPATDQTDALAQTAQGANRELVLVLDRVRQAEADIRSTQLAARPSLSFSGAAGYRNGYLPEINRLRFNEVAGVNLSVPLYAGKRYKLQEQAAQVNLTASRYAVETANAQLRQNIEQTLADMRANAARLQNLSTAVAQADKALALAQTRLRNGVITPVELQAAETGVEEARLAQLSFQYQLLLNQLELKRLLGENL